ncbi:MAG: MarR family transcriptional regulator [Methanotrichaceae archaeon]|nr:MarR family transcriptional regulator [Methanotrichaceae archaeon]
MRAIKLFAALVVLGLLLSPTSALPAQSVHIKIGCPLMSGGCNGSQAMNCCGKCPYGSQPSQGSTCQISLFSGIEVSDPNYSNFGKGSSSPSYEESPSINSARSINRNIYRSPSQVDFEGTGPPDLDVIEYLPPAAKLIFNVLASDGPLTQKDILSRTDLPRRKVRYALGKLIEENVIRERFSLADARQSLYYLDNPIVKARE